MTTFEERNRARKASALLVQCLAEERTAKEVARFHPHRWVALAERAGVQPPSFLTLALVIENLERRTAGREAA